LARAALQAHGKSTRGLLGSHSVVVAAHPIGAHGALFIVQDRTFLDARRKHVLQILFVSAEFALLAFLLLARAGARIGSRRTVEAARSVVHLMRSRTTGEIPIPPDLRLLVRDMHDAVQHLRSENGGRDGAERLRELVNAEIPSGGLIVIANREPYAHEFDEGGKVVVRQPASGLVTGIEPMLRACGGTWIAHGGGSADRVTADRMGRVAVPPSAPEYTLRRLWIEEEASGRFAISRTRSRRSARWTGLPTRPSTKPSPAPQSRRPARTGYCSSRTTISRSYRSSCAITRHTS
jgi:trehalose 6-phosphate synthase